MRDNYKFRKSMANDQEFDQYRKENPPEKRDIEIIDQKVIIESMIYLDDFEIVVYTTVCPRTSLIFISKSKKSHKEEKEQDHVEKGDNTTDFFKNKLLAKLKGHKTHNPPTFAFVPQSGCLISGEKLSRNVVKERDDNPHLLNNALSSVMFEKEDKGVDFNKNRSADILIWNLQKSLFSKFETNPPWVIEPTRIIESAHYDSIISFTYLPYAQLIASSSTDNTIKLWNPIARPYSLVNQDGEASVEIKPGYYKKRK